MPKGTKKVGISGRYGPRYGVKIRRRAREVLELKARRHPCPRCQQVAVRRVSTGVWRCRHCDYTFAGGAYKPVVTTAITRQVVKAAVAGPAGTEEEK